MCDAVGKQRHICVPSTPSNSTYSTLQRFMRKISYLTASRPPRDRVRNDYTQMPGGKISAVRMDEPCTSSYGVTCVEPREYEQASVQRQSRSTSNMKIGRRRSLEDVCIEGKLNLQTIKQRPKLDLSRRVGGTTRVESHKSAQTRHKWKRAASADPAYLRYPAERNSRSSTSAGIVPGALAVTEQRCQVTQSMKMGICATCHRCRCANCARPKHLPSRWVCGDTCLLSSGCIVDTLSCMCCVKAIRYHCRCCAECFITSEEKKLREASSWKPKGFAGVASLLIASIFLPCLCCYLPLKACETGIESIYQAWNDHACHCDAKLRSSDTTPTLDIIIEQPKASVRLHTKSSKI